MFVLSVPQALQFVEAYLARPDATAAAQAIGFEEDAETAGARILAMPSIQKRIADGLRDLSVSDARARRVFEGPATVARQALGVIEDAS